MRKLVHRFLAITFALLGARATPALASPAYLSDFLWREVRNRQGETLGSVSDVLVHLPSGRMVFIAVMPSAFFERPKAVPPDAFKLPSRADAPLELDISSARWITAPRVDWDAAMVIKNSAAGAKIYGFYSERWEEPPQNPEHPVTVVASTSPSRPEVPIRYVSLKKLLLDRVSTTAWEQTGFLRDFLLDWSDRRATHALVSPQFTPLATADRLWFAIPTPLLNPPIESDAIRVNAELGAFRSAARMSAERATHTKPLQIVRVPAEAADEKSEINGRTAGS